MAIERQTRKVDFHVHYESRNGNVIEEIIASASDENVSAIALIGRLEIDDELPKHVFELNNKDIDVLYGVEYPVELGNKLVDLISIGFDVENKDLRNLFGKEERMASNRQLARWQKDFLEGKGFSFEHLEGEDQGLLESLLNGDISEKAIRFCNLVTKNEANSIQVMKYIELNSETWDYVITRFSGRLGYQEFEKLKSKFLWKLFFAYNQEGYLPIQREASPLIDAVHRANGIVLYSPEGNFDQGIWEDLIESEIDGIMGWHGGRLELTKNTIKDAKDHNLIILGGSDFHPDLKDWQVGVGDGAMYISSRRYNELKSRLNTERGEISSNDNRG